MSHGIYIESSFIDKTQYPQKIVFPYLASGSLDKLDLFINLWSFSVQNTKVGYHIIVSCVIHQRAFRQRYSYHFFRSHLSTAIE